MSLLDGIIIKVGSPGRPVDSHVRSPISLSSLSPSAAMSTRRRTGRHLWPPEDYLHHSQLLRESLLRHYRRNNADSQAFWVWSLIHLLLLGTIIYQFTARGKEIVVDTIALAFRPPRSPERCLRLLLGQALVHPRFRPQSARLCNGQPDLLRRQEVPRDKGESVAEEVFCPPPLPSTTDVSDCGLIT